MLRIVMWESDACPR